ncbi:MAG: AMP-dependent synthetase [Rhodospirillales bacterium 70-18]|nr:AMP-binding protein [Rhodospirillales bacterium]OJY70326.1 MAG: AMP-dependent synthetase [Rhodospirillales bacterium 70-18]
MSLEAFRAARDFLLTHRTDYHTAYTHFRWPEMQGFNWALDWFDGVLAKGDTANAPALRITGAGEAELTFAELSARSNSVAQGLRALGVARGDRILLMLGNIAPLWEIMLAAMKLGAVVVPATTLLTADDLAERVARARVRFVIATAEDAPKLAAVPAGIPRITVGGSVDGSTDYATLLAHPATFTPDGSTGADDPLLLYFTSGTTAKPKLVLHSHRSYPLGHLSTMYWLGLQPGDVHLNVSSPGWAKHAWSCLFAPWNAGACVFIANQPRFNARALLDAIAAHKVTSLCAPPTVWRMFIQEDLKSWHTSLREVCGAGEPLNPEVIDQVRAAWNLTIRDGYGQTETTAQIGNPPGQPVKPGSMGRPLPGYTIRLLDPEGAEAREGSVCIPLHPRPAALMRGYQNDAGGIDEIPGTEYHTGDIASRDDDGYLTYVGRADDVFKASDYRISPFELESVLIEHPMVAEAAVVPAPDPVRLAVPKAYISLAGGANGSPEVALSIFQHLRARLAPYKRIRRLEFAELPKTISGKIRRVELRRSEEGRTGRAEGEYREDDFPELKQG